MLKTAPWTLQKRHKFRSGAQLFSNLGVVPKSEEGLADETPANTAVDRDLASATGHFRTSKPVKALHTCRQPRG